MEVSLLELLSVEVNCSLADAFGDAAYGNASGARALPAEEVLVLSRSS